jgi:hypothetical protein
MWNEDFSSLKILPTKCCLRLFFIHLQLILDKLIFYFGEYF